MTSAADVPQRTLVVGLETNLQDPSNDVMKC